jgi:hypothetical protein
MEVCPLARGMMLPYERNPYPGDYGPAFACSIVLYPLARHVNLAAALPFREANGLTVFRFCHQQWVRPALSTGGVGCP